MELCWSSIIDTVKDFFVILVSLVGIIVAILGLSTWKLQLRGKAEYELSKRILVTAFKYRNAINSARSPLMSVDVKMGSDTNFKVEYYKSTSKAYQIKLDKIQIERAALYADLLESEVIWGDELKNLFKGIFDLHNELYECIIKHIEITNPDCTKYSRKDISTIKKDNNDTLYENYNNDGFKDNLETVIKNIEEYLKQYLKHT